MSERQLARTPVFDIDSTGIISFPRLFQGNPTLTRGNDKREEVVDLA